MTRRVASPRERPLPEAPTDPSVDGPRESFRPPRALRVLAEVGAGLVTSAGAGILGGVLGYGLCETTGWGAHDKLRCLAPIVALSFLGLNEGYGLGVWWGGEALRGDGSLALTLLGATAGALGGYALLQSGNPELGGYSLIVLPILLSHLGYELFQREPPGIQPLVSVSAQGTVLGVGGRF